MSERQVYIHYGANKFDEKKFAPIKNEPGFSKPRGGLWCSRVDAEYGWIDWCQDEGYRISRLNKCFKFHIKENANIVRINNMNDIHNLCDGVETQKLFGKKFAIDFESMANRGVDAIELCTVGCIGVDIEYWDTVYGWDCQSMVIFNPDIIEVIE